MRESVRVSVGGWSDRHVRARVFEGRCVWVILYVLRGHTFFERQHFKRCHGCGVIEAGRAIDLGIDTTSDPYVRIHACVCARAR